MMRNRILTAFIFILPVGLFCYFLLHPVADKETPAEANPVTPTNALPATNTAPSL
jgi:predicted membrane protein